MKTLKPFLVAFLLFGSSAAQAQTISVTGGQIHGAMLEKGGAVFKGIPYAAPPIGRLRWREPAPVISWSGLREATTFGPPCAQAPSVILRSGSRQEDCLYLNVW